MTKFNDFDLDLKKIKSNNNPSKSSLPTPFTPLEITYDYDCLDKSYDTPTTGYSQVCCKKNAKDNTGIEPKCIP